MQNYYFLEIIVNHPETRIYTTFTWSLILNSIMLFSIPEYNYDHDFTAKILQRCHLILIIRFFI